jgi:hypothetical protein
LPSPWWESTVPELLDTVSLQSAEAAKPEDVARSDQEHDRRPAEDSIRPAQGKRRDALKEEYLDREAYGEERDRGNAPSRSAGLTFGC